jgi:isoleucyl-tRNA synthetase
VRKEIEALRTADKVGSSLQAEVEIVASGEKLKLLKGLDDDLRFVLITSRATVARAASEADEAIHTLPSPHAKCERCWHYRADVDSDPAHPGICGRCVQNLYGSGEPRRFA